MKMSTIRIQPGALDSVPIVDLARFLGGHGLELAAKPDGLVIRRAGVGTAEGRAGEPRHKDAGQQAGDK